MWPRPCRCDYGDMCLLIYPVHIVDLVPLLLLVVLGDAVLVNPEVVKTQFSRRLNSTLDSSRQPCGKSVTGFVVLILDSPHVRECSVLNLMARCLVNTAIVNID